MTITIIVTATANDGRTVNLTASQVEAIQTLSNTRKGGVGSVTGYKPTSNYVEGKEPVQNIQLIANFSTANLYARKIKALQEIEYGDVVKHLFDDEKLSSLSMNETLDIFNARKAMMIASMQKSLDGARDDAYRAAHDLCYVIIGDVKCHLVTEKKTVDGKKTTVPVMDKKGNVTVASIMVNYLELNKTTVVEGERKPKPNSGLPVLMSNAIKKCLNKRSVDLKTLSLKADNFTSFKVDKKEFLPEHVTRFGDLIA